MYRDINLLPEEYIIKPISSVKTYAGIAAIFLFIFFINCYEISYYFGRLPSLNKQINAFNEAKQSNSVAFENYKIIINKQREINKLTDIVNSVKSTPKNLAHVFQQLKNANLKDNGFSIKSCAIQQNGTILLNGTASDINQITKYISNLKVSGKGNDFSMVTLTKTNNEKNSFTFEISANIGKGSGN